MKTIISINCLIFFLLINNKIYSQENAFYLFQNFLHNGKISNSNIINSNLELISTKGSSYKNINSSVLFPIGNNLEIGTKLGYYFETNGFENSVNLDFANIIFVGKYGFKISGVNFTIGPKIDYRFGSSIIADKELLLVILGATNYQINNKFQVYFSYGKSFGTYKGKQDQYNYNDSKIDYLNHSGLGLLYSLSEKISFVLEGNVYEYKVLNEYQNLFSLGCNYKTESIGIIRVFFGTGAGNNDVYNFSLGIIF